MTSPAHDVLVQALRDDVALLPEILSRLRGIVLPRVIGAMDSAVRLSRPVEVRPDVVHRTAEGWVVCEVQNKIDRKKGRRWLLASSVLLDETQRMGDVVVLTASAAVARWASRAGHVRGPGGTQLHVTPVVVHLSLRAARALLDPKAPELAIWAAWAMRQRHGAAAARVVEDAIALSDLLPPPLQDAQLRAILDVLSQRMLVRIREVTMHPSSAPERPAVRKLREILERQGHARGLAEGRTEGRTEGQALGKQEALLLIFSGRGLPVTAEERAHIQACMDVELLSVWLRRAITAGSVAEALAPAPRARRPAIAPARKPAAPPRRARSKATDRATPGDRSRSSVQK